MLKISSFFIAVFFFFSFASTLFAQKHNGVLEVSPAYLEVVLEKPDEEKAIELQYSNTSKQSVSLELYAIDFKQQGEQGGIIFLGEDSKTYSYSLSSFLSFESNNLEIASGEKRTFIVKVKNREDISPGGHYAAIIARQVQDTNETSVSPAVSSLVFMRKTGGERFNLSVQKIGWPRLPIQFSVPLHIEITFQNAGNIHVIPYGRAEIRDMFGRLLYKGIVNDSSAIIFPESRRRISLDFKAVEAMLPFSLNSFRVVGNDSLHKVQYVYQDSFLYINPPTFIVIILISILLLIFIRRERKH